MNSNANWTLRIRNQVYKELVEFPSKDQKRIIQLIESLPFNPYVCDIQKMKGEENVWRRRLGAYRIFFEIIPQEKIIHVFQVERRTSKTY